MNKSHMASISSIAGLGTLHNAINPNPTCKLKMTGIPDFLQNRDSLSAGPAGYHLVVKGLDTGQHIN